MTSPRADLAVLALAVLLLAPALAPTGAAQGGRSDLQVTALAVSNPRVLAPTEILVTVENRGTATFDATSGWQVFVGWNGVGQSDCIEGDGLPGSACYVVTRPGLTNRNLAPGDSLQLTVPWTPDPAQRGDGFAFVHLQRFGTVPRAEYADDPPAGPDDVSANNVRRFAVTVNAAGVVAVADRDAHPGSADPNRPWSRAQIDARDSPDCLVDAVNRHGCRARPGTTVRWAYVVRNHGTLADAFTGSLVYDTPERERELADKGYRFSLSEGVVTIPPGESRTVHLDVHVGEREDFGRGLNLNETGSPVLALRWVSSVTPDAATDSPPTTHCPPGQVCVNPTFPSLYAGPRRAFELVTTEASKPVHSGASVTFQARITNLGNHEDTFTARFVPERSDFGESWRPRVVAPGPIPARGSANLTVDLLPPHDAVAGVHRFEIVVQAQGDASLARNLSFDANLTQRYGLLANLLPSTSEVAPGERASYLLTVTNTGNGPDNATVALSGAPVGWEATLSETTLRLPPLGKATAVLNLSAPPGTAAGVRAAVTVGVTSQGSNNPSGFPRERAPDVTAELLVLSRPHPRVTLDGPARRFVDPGASTDYVLNVRNVGNLASNFTVRLDPSDASWGAIATPESLVLDPLASGLVTVRLQAPSDASVGETNRLVVTVQSASARTQQEQLTLTGMVSAPDLVVRAVTMNSTAPYSGDPLALDVVVANEGNKAPPRDVRLRVLFIQAGVERVLGERDLRPADLPGGRRLTERFVWDTTGVEGPGVVVARIDPDDLVPEVDDSSRSNEGSLALTLRTFGLTLTPPAPLSGRPGEKVAYDATPHVFLLRHRGNQAVEPVEVHVESRNGWIDPAKAVRTLELPRGEDVPVPIEVLIPFRPNVPSDLLRVTVVPQLRPGGAVSTAVLTRVIDDEKPVIAGVLARPSKVRVGENVTLEAVVRDATGVARVTAHLVAPDNGTSSLPMAPVGGDRWALSQTFPVAGAWRFFVEAADRAEPANVNATRHALVELLVDPGDAPLIRLAEGQSAAVRPGTQVALNITHPLGIARAAYVIRGITYGMERPYAIDTSGFPLGPIEVLVEAESVQGAKGVARINLTITDAPPGIRSVRISPDPPAAGRDALVTVETDRDVRSVQLLVRKDGRAVATLDAQERSPGVFEARFQPEEGRYELDVRATNEAGNEQRMSGALRFDTRPDDGIPAPGVPLALLATLGAAALARRRRA